MKKFLKTSIVSLSLTAAMTVVGATPVFAGKISYYPQPPTFTLNESQSLAMTVQLSQPLLAPGPDPAYLDINFTSSDPTRVSVNPIHYDYLEWAQQKSFTITTLNDGIYNTDNTVTITSAVVSNAPYYSTFIPPVITINLVDIDPAPAAPVDTIPATSSSPAVSQPAAPKKAVTERIAPAPLQTTPVASTTTDSTTTNTPVNTGLQNQSNKSHTATKASNKSNISWPWLGVFILVVMAIAAEIFRHYKIKPKPKKTKKHPAKNK